MIDFTRGRVQADRSRLSRWRSHTLGSGRPNRFRTECARRGIPEREARSPADHFRRPGVNIIDTVNRILGELPSIQATVPKGWT